MFCAALTVFIATLVWAAVVGPDRMPLHYGPHGADRWGSKAQFLTWTGAVGALMAALFGGLALAGPRLPAGLINTPHRDVWLAPEHRPEFDRVFRSAMWSLGAPALMLFAALNVSAADEGHHSGLTPPLIGAVAVWLIAVMGWLITRLFRPPTDG